MTQDLRKKTIHGVAWSALQRFSQSGMQMVIQLVLARLLGPEVFGVVAMLAVFQAVAQSLVDSGFSSALIQRKEISSLDISSVFYFNIALSVVVSSLLCAASPWIAAFYEKPILLPLTCFFSLVPIVSAFGMTQFALLRRTMNFKRAMLANVPATVLSGTLGIALALLGWGVWALAWQMLAYPTIRSALFWLLSDWRPRREFSWKPIREMFRFGSKMLASGLLNQIFLNLYIIVIAKLFDETTVGLYSYAARLRLMISGVVISVVSSVMFPAFSAIQDDAARMARALSVSLKTLMLGNGLIMLSLVALARPAFALFLGKEWLDAIPYFQWLCIIGLLTPFHALNLQTLMGQGRSDLFLKLEILKKILTIANLAITCRWGVMALIYGQLVSSIISFALNSHYSGKHLRYGAWAQIWDALPSLLPGLAATGTMWGLLHLLGGLPLIAQLLLSGLAGLVIWALVAYACRLEAFLLLCGLVRRRSSAENKANP